MLPAYSYSPKALLRSFEKLEAREMQKLNEENDPAGGGVTTTTITTKANKKRKLPESTPCNKSNYNHQQQQTTATTFTVAAVQLIVGGLSSSEVGGYYDRACQAIEKAALSYNADIILLPELFVGPYFCQSQNDILMGLAREADRCFVVQRMQQLAIKYNVVLPISIFERKNNALYNTVVMIDVDGTILGKYRKSHIPDGTGYQEKFYFSPGDTGFQVWETSLGIKVGVAICWDQWFPECARSMALQGADIILYPTAIGSEPQDPSINSADHWQRTMQGHSAANMIPVVASNRYGTEILLNNEDEDSSEERQRITFYGKSFITDETGAIIAEANNDDDGGSNNNTTTDDNDHDPFTILVSKINSSKNRSTRLAWGLFRDRRPDLYGILQTKDGCSI